MIKASSTEMCHPGRRLPVIMTPSVCLEKMTSTPLSRLLSCCSWALCVQSLRRGVSSVILMQRWRSDVIVVEHLCILRSRMCFSLHVFRAKNKLEKMSLYIFIQKKDFSLRGSLPAE